MVVQQGRLQNKDKLSKDELLDALRFGADKVFRAGAEGDSITDEDIDMILDRGRKKTEEMAAKLQDNDKVHTSTHSPTHPHTHLHACACTYAHTHRGTCWTLRWTEG